MPEYMMGLVRFVKNQLFLANQMCLPKFMSVPAACTAAICAHLLSAAMACFNDPAKFPDTIC